MSTVTLTRTNRRSFNEWLRLVNRYIVLRLGVALEEMDDLDCRGYYDDDLSPAEAARDILAEIAEAHDLDIGEDE